MLRSLKLTLALAMALLLAACGFRLQGASVLPEGLGSVHVVARDELSAFAVELFRGLERAGAQRATTPAEAGATLRITVDRTGRRVLSMSTRNTPQEFEIFYVVEYSIDAGGEQVVPPQRLELTRNISFDESQLLAKDREQEILRDAMARDLAGLVLRRLESLPAAQSDPAR